MILPLERLSSDGLAAVLAYRSRAQGQVLRLTADGEVVWRTWTREAIRSDTHQLTVHVGERLELCGSPARSAGLPTNVFGSDDLAVCAEAHVALAERSMGLVLPREGWHVSRVDVTQNFDLGGPSAVRQALAVLRHASGGRYTLRDAAETLYWGKRGGGGRMGKAYAKGPHLLRQCARGEAVASAGECEAAMRLLRLELTLGRKALQRLGVSDPFRVYDVSMVAEHYNYFSALIGGCEVVSMDSLFERVVRVAPSEGQARAALATLGRVRVEGVEVVKASMPKSSWHRHKAILFGAGLSWSDLSSGRVLELRRAPLVLGDPVLSWADLARRRAA